MITKATVRGQAATASTSTRRRRAARLRAVAVTALAALAVWALAELVLGIDLREPSLAGPGPTRDVGATQVLVSSTVAALAGWGLLAALERLVARAGTVWALVAVVVAAGSAVAPLTGTGITAANRAVLVVLHLLVGAVLIPLLYRTSPRRSW